MLPVRGESELFLHRGIIREKQSEPIDETIEMEYVSTESVNKRASYFS